MTTTPPPLCKDAPNSSIICFNLKLVFFSTKFRSSPILSPSRQGYCSPVMVVPSSKLSTSSTCSPRLPMEWYFHAMSLILYTFFDKSPLDLRSAIMAEGKQYFTIEQTYTNATLKLAATNQDRCIPLPSITHTSPLTVAETLYSGKLRDWYAVHTETDLQAILDVYEGCSALD